MHYHCTTMLLDWYIVVLLFTYLSDQLTFIKVNEKHLELVFFRLTVHNTNYIQHAEIIRHQFLTSRDSSGWDDVSFFSDHKPIILCHFLYSFHQVNLEPEGKIYISITLTGSFTDGKYMLLFCIRLAQSQMYTAKFLLSNCESSFIHIPENRYVFFLIFFIYSQSVVTF